MQIAVIIAFIIVYLLIVGVITELSKPKNDFEDSVTILLAMCWPLVVAVLPLYGVLHIGRYITRKIKKHYGKK